jgi:NAD(P)-dependent dehydrogenase (short-subunit alcohol dehydrogenase family)
MRLKDKVAVVVGAGQTPGDSIGNGRATSILFAREGAKVLLVDRNLASAEETARMIADEGGVCSVLRADVLVESDCKAIAETCVARYQRIDVLQNIVGSGSGDRGITSLPEETWDFLMDINLKSVFFTCKYALPYMRQQKAGSIINVTSGAAVGSVGYVGYKVSKAGANALTHSIAMSNARFGVRANVVMPGLLDTPMAMEGHSAAKGIDKDTLRRERDALVPLNNKQGTAWDTAYASLFLASDEAKFITGIVLPVDGGQSARIG